MNSNLPYLRCIEFFSGIGGYHFALNNSQLKGEIIAAYDTNEIANKVYNNCFGKKPNNRVINVLTANELNKLDCNCWLMSPPCQPYTRGGKQLDLEDNRTSALKNLIDILPKLNKLPEFIMVENVVNFETSQSHSLLITQLKALNYNILEFLLSPVQINIPNERPRYFLMAKLLPFTDRLNKFTEGFISKWPENEEEKSKEKDGIEDNGCDTPLKTILESKETNIEDYLVPDKWLLKSHNFRFDIVNSEDYRSSCFTKSYGSHHIFGSGSLISSLEDLEDLNVDFSNSQTLIPLKLRFLTPKEVSLLMGFPLKNISSEIHWIPKNTQNYLEFPSDIKNIQKYKLLGNSLNVSLVTKLMDWFWKDEIEINSNKDGGEC